MPWRGSPRPLSGMFSGSRNQREPSAVDNGRAHESTFTQVKCCLLKAPTASLCLEQMKDGAVSFQPPALHWWLILPQKRAMWQCRHSKKAATAEKNPNSWKIYLPIHIESWEEWLSGQDLEPSFHNPIPLYVGLGSGIIAKFPVWRPFLVTIKLSPRNEA